MKRLLGVMLGVVLMSQPVFAMNKPYQYDALSNQTVELYHENIETSWVKHIVGYTTTDSEDMLSENNSGIAALKTALYFGGKKSVESTSSIRERLIGKETMHDLSDESFAVELTANDVEYSYVKVPNTVKELQTYLKQGIVICELEDKTVVLTGYGKVNRFGSSQQTIEMLKDNYAPTIAYRKQETLLKDIQGENAMMFVVPLAKTK